MRIFQWHKRKSFLGVGVVVLLLFCGLAVLAEARVGGGRSMGSRGSRSFSAPARPSAPSPSNSFGQRSPSSPSPYASQSPSPSPSPRSTPYPSTSPYGGGSFWRSVGGGLLGGFLGSMLFRSLGFAGGGGYGGYGGGWGGPGLFDLLLLGVIGYVAYRFFSQRSARVDDYDGANRSSPVNSDRYLETEPTVNSPVPQRDFLTNGVEQLRMLDPGFDQARFCDQAMDFFFRLQAAWSARDLSPLLTLVTDELLTQLQADVEQLKRDRKINRVENIAVRTCELTEAWQETGRDFATVYFYANCLDYDVDEATGEVVRGSKTEPSKFEEYWTFARPAGSGPWQLSAITQA